MVLAERNSELVRNGRRSRGPSPNGHGASSGSASGNAGAPGGTGTPETSSDDDNSIKRNGKSKAKQSEYEEKIRVGRDYQAVCPALIPEPDRKPEILNDRALLVWSPTKDIPDTKLEEYISVAKEKYGYNGEQALGMLFWHKHDLERAVMDLANFTPFPDEWTVEDKVLFEQAFQFHGKSFHRIRQMLPDKSIASLVKYYYSWKKTRHRQSVMDRQEKVKANKEGGSSENGSDNGSNEESDNDDKEQALSSLQTGNLNDQTNDSHHNVNNSEIGGGIVGVELDTNHISNNVANKLQLQQLQTTPSLTNSDSINSNGINNAITNHASIISSSSTSAAGYCSNCGVVCNILNSSPHGKLCSSCHHHWRRTGNKRPTSGPYFGKRSRDRNAERHKRKPPRGMYINHDDIVALASSNDNQDELLSNIDREIVSLLSQEQALSSLQTGNLNDQTNDSHHNVNNSEIGGGIVGVELDTNHISNNVANKLQLQQLQTTPSLTNSDSINSNGINNAITNHASIISSSSTSAAGYCSNCGVVCNILNSSPHGKLCSSCHHHWRRTGNKRPTSGPYFGKRSRDRNAERHKRKPPRGMYINHDDIVALASSNDNQDELLSNIDREIVSLLSQVQLNKQNISALKRKNSDNLEEIRPNENTNRINARWTNDENLLAVQGVRKYGKDFQAIAETLGTKTEAHVKTFYINNRRRYNLDQIIKKHDADKEANAPVNTTNTLSSSSNATNSNSTTNVDAISSSSIGKKDELQSSSSSSSQLKKKEIVPNCLNEESDNTTSSETAISKSTISTINNTTEQRKSESSLSGITTKDTIVLEIDLDAEQSEIQQPSAKKIALSISNQDFPKASPV